MCCDSHKSKKIVPKIIKHLDEQDVNSDYSFIKKNSKDIKIKHQVYRNYIKALFDIENNFDFLLKKEDINEIHNDSSLLFMNGIKGISMITFLFGCIFINLFNTPVTSQTMDNFYNNLSSPSFFIFYFGIKFAPKLLLCSSGFSLLYKFMCFLDDKYESEKALKNIQKQEKNKKNTNNTKSNEEGNKESSNTNTDSRNSSFNDSSSEYFKKKREKLNIPFKYFFLFFASQIHKYILYLLILFFILFSLFDFALIFIDLGPMWNFFKENMIDSSINIPSIIPSIFGFQGYFYNHLDKDSILNFFYLVYQEISYFIISTIFIFFGYKYHWRIDRFILCSISFLWIFRIIFYILNYKLNAKEYFSFHGYYFFYNSIIYNYIYYLFGIYFGCINYVIQKRINYYDCDKQGKSYLLGFARLLKIIKKKSRLLFYILGIVFLILIIILSFGQCLLFLYIKLFKYYNENDKNFIPTILTDYNNNTFCTIIMLIDADIVVLLANFMALFFYLKGDNFIYDFLKLNFWGIFNKIYFSFILLINPIILYVFHITESRINFNMQNCYLYSCACGILLFSLLVLVYAILELPYKKTIRLFLKRNEIKLGQKTLGILEKNSIVDNQIEFKDEFNKSNDDSGSGNDNDEENDNENNHYDIKLQEKFIEDENGKD